MGRLVRYRWLVWLLVLVVVVGCGVLYPFGETEAFVPLLVAPEALNVMAALAAAAGVYIISQPAVQAVGLQLWQAASDGLRSLVQGAQDGVVTVTSSVWHEVQDLAARLGGPVTGYVQSGVDTVDLRGTDKFYYYNNSERGVALWTITTMTGGTTYCDLREWVNGQAKPRYQVFASVKAVTGGLVQWIYVLDSSTGQKLYEWLGNLNDIGGTLAVEATLAGVAVSWRGAELWATSNSAFFSCTGWSCSRGERVAGTYELGLQVSTNLRAGQDYLYDGAYWGNPSWDLSNKTVTLPTDAGAVVGNVGEAVVSNVSTAVAPPTVTEEVPGTVTGWLSTIYDGVVSGLSGVRSAVQSVGAAVTALPGEIVTGVTNAISTAFTPTVTMEAVLEEIGDAAEQRVPFVWFEEWSQGAGVAYGNEELRFEWQPGLISETVSVTMPGIEGVRGLSTLLILAGSCWAAYGEIRRWLG